MIHRFFIRTLVVASIALAGCQEAKQRFFGSTDNKSLADTIPQPITLEDTQAALQPKPVVLPIDELANKTAKFIAGMPDPDFLPEKISTPYYKNHQKTIDEQWSKIEDKDLKPIRMWRYENKVSVPADTLTMIYPFSGPDILYANTFFPYCKNYIMIGLEDAGSLPNLSTVPDTTMAAYLQGIHHSLRYINSKGYFVTSQMSKDFNRQKLNGTIHILLYYLARTGHTISEVNEFYLDQYGKAQVTTADHISPKDEIRGINIKFFDPKLNYIQEVHYFPFDLSDENVKKKSEFLYFVNSFGPKVFYTKSASYILHDSKFSTIRELLLGQSKKFLQDDTGIPYFLLDDGDFRLTLYGNYTRTINDFDKQFQPKLKEALDARTQDLSLPFKIGYNAWFNQTVLIYGESISADEKQKLLAERKAWRKKQVATVATTKPDTQLANSKGVTFRVQFLVSANDYEPNHPILAGLKNVGHYTAGDKICFTIGNVRTLAELAPYKALATKAGFKDAFAVAFNNGSRISISEAQNLTKIK